MNLQDMKTTDLRIKAREMGLKGLSSANKATLVPAIEAEITRLLAEAAATPAKPKGKCCESCGVRPIGREAKADGLGHLCDPCYHESGWENTHSDSGHDECPTIEEINDPTAEWTDETDKANALAIRAEMEHCWICHPELNKASAEYVGRAGTSRLGMTFNVTIKASGEEKAREVTALLKARGLSGAKVSETEEGDVQLTLAKAGIVCVWTVEGRRLVTKVHGKNVRNVSEILQKLA